MYEPRTGVMILVEASWQEVGGAVHGLSARMVDKSAGGACIQVKRRIVVGSKLRIKGRWEEFSGVAKYCRSDGMDYLVGIQRDPATTPVLSPAILMPPTMSETETNRDAPVATLELQSASKGQAEKLDENAVPARKLEGEPSMRIVNAVASAPAPRAERREMGNAAAAKIIPPPTAETKHEAGGFGRSRPQRSSVLRPSEVQTKQPPARKEADKGKKTMRRKWLDLTSWHNTQDGVSGGADESNGAAVGEKVNRERQAPPFTDKILADSAGEGAANSQVELLPMEDIYRVAGVTNPRRGYGIGKVIEMLQSEHMRGLSIEMKRAAVLMALHAAGIPVDEILQDAKARQDALNSYEAEQHEQSEGEWARRAEENVQIQAELERVKAHYMARISRNLDVVAREKAKFGAWVERKHQESETMSEAVGLCLQPSVSERGHPDVGMAASAK